MNRSVFALTFAAALACPVVGVAKPRPEGDAVAAVSPARVSGEVIVLLASQAEGGARSVDPAIGSLPQLSKPPFNAYGQWKLLDRQTVSLERNKATTVALAEGRTLELTYSELAADKRFRVAAALLKGDKPGVQKVNVVAAAQEPFFLAGQKFQGGILFIGITLKP
jgi:hypothetical protein